MEALSTIGSGTVTVSLSTGVYTITFGGGSLDNTNVNPLQGDVSTATYGTVDRTISTTYDFASRITGVNSFQDGQTYYTHDASDQLTDADHTGQADESYSFDANGNRSSYTIGTNNLIASDGTFNFAYDDEGNRVTKTNIATGSYTTYAWDYRNRLTSVRDYNSSNVLLKETTNSYDPYNRLVKSTYDADGLASKLCLSFFLLVRLFHSLPFSGLRRRTPSPFSAP